MPRYAKASAQPPRPELVGASIPDLMEALSPSLDPPDHMAKVVRAFDSCRPGVVRAARRERTGRRIAIAAPVQHGKSTIEQHFVVGCLLDDPTYKIAMCGYGQEFVRPQSKVTREIARMAGIQFKDDEDTILRWGTPEGGFAMFTTVSGALTGFGFDCILIDDPFKSREEVERLDMREKVWVWYTQTVLPRLAPWTDIILIASRWHTDDLTGRLLQRGYEHVHLKAIQDDGTALWPTVRPIEFLLEQKKQMGEYAFFGNFQGEPFTDGDTTFGPPTRYETIPDYPGFRYVIGFDLAYSASRSSDYFAYAVLKVYGSCAYVVEVRRTKSDLKLLANALGEQSRRYGHAPCVAYVSGPERGAILYLAEQGINVSMMPARMNKRFRAQRTRDRWNKGQVVWPLVGAWVDPCLGRFTAFRGNDGDQDDEVDALVAAMDFGVHDGVSAPRAFGRPRM